MTQAEFVLRLAISVVKFYLSDYLSFQITNTKQRRAFFRYICNNFYANQS